MPKLLIIGSGPGGYEAAIRARQNELEVVLFEQGEVGGTCLNRGCIPTKALLHAAELYTSDTKASDWGIEFSSKKVDLHKVYQKKDEIVQTLRQGVEMLLKNNGVELIRKRAQVLSPKEVTAGNTTYQGDAILLAVGSVPSVPPITGLKLSERIVTSDGILQRPPLGKKVAVLGGGVIGVEMATFLSAFGFEVDIIEAMPRLLPEMDDEIGHSLQMNFRRDGVKTHTGAKVTAVEEKDNQVFISLEKGEIICDTLLVATGRKANADNLFADGCPKPANVRGRFTVDEHGQTDVEGLYAIGDIITGAQLAHAASTQGKMVADYLAGRDGETDNALVPGCIYTSPEIATVGMTLDEAKDKGFDALMAKYLMAGNGRTLIAGTGRGFVKVVAEKESGRILGAQLMCDRASDMIDEFTLAIANKLSYQDMLKGMRPHPTFVEGAQEALEAFESRAIHIAPRRR